VTTNSLNILRTSLRFCSNETLRNFTSSNFITVYQSTRLHWCTVLIPCLQLITWRTQQKSEVGKLRFRPGTSIIDPRTIRLRMR